MSSSGSYDAIVVGGGHNGLVARPRTSPAPAPARVVLESRHKTGGAATTESPWPDAPEFKVTRLSYVMSLMPPTIMRELEPRAPRLQGVPDGPVLPGVPGRRLDQDPRRRRQAQPRGDLEVVEEGRRRDGPSGTPGWVASPTSSARCSPRAAEDRLDAADRPARTRCGWPGATAGSTSRTIGDVTRLMAMSIADLLDDWFESPQVKGAMAVNGVIGTWAGPCEPGTAYVMAHHSIGDIGDGHLGNWGFPEGGMGGVVGGDRELGPQLRRRDPHQCQGGPRCWSRTAGSRARCSRTATSCALRWSSPACTRGPRSSTTSAAQHLPSDFVRDIETLEDPQRRREDQPGARRAARLHRRPGHQPAGAPHRLGGDGAVGGVHGAGVPGRPRTASRRCGRSATA